MYPTPVLPVLVICFYPPRLWHWGSSLHTLYGFSSCTSSIWTASESQWCLAGSVLAVFAFVGRLRLLLSIARLASVSGVIFWNEVSGAIRSVFSPGLSEVLMPVFVSSTSMFVSPHRTPWAGVGVCLVCHSGGIYPWGLCVFFAASRLWGECRLWPYTTPLLFPLGLVFQLGFPTPRTSLYLAISWWFSFLVALSPSCWCNVACHICVVCLRGFLRPSFSYIRWVHCEAS